MSKLTFSYLALVYLELGCFELGRCTVLMGLYKLQELASNCVSLFLSDALFVEKVVAESKFTLKSRALRF